MMSLMLWQVRVFENETLTIEMYAVIFLLSMAAANAESYKGIDTEGEVEYSDESFGDAETFKAPPVQVVPHEESKKDLSSWYCALISATIKQTCKSILCSNLIYM